eukprot:683645-Amphidinium_carterae.1
MANAGECWHSAAPCSAAMKLRLHYGGGCACLHLFSDTCRWNTGRACIHGVVSFVIQAASSDSLVAKRRPWHCWRSDNRVRRKVLHWGQC